MKIILYLFLFSSILGYEYKEVNLNKKDITKDYNSWKDKELDLELKNNLRELILLKSQGEMQDEVLKQMYKNAKYRNYIENKKLENDLIRAKIYWYYYNNYRRYYYYDIDYHINFIN